MGHDGGDGQRLGLGLVGDRVDQRPNGEQAEQVEPAVREAGAEVEPELGRDLEARPRAMPALRADRAQKIE